MTARVRTKPYPCCYSCDHTIDPASPPDLATISYGGGVQSTALLVLAATGRIPFSTFLFCNVGDDSEHPATLAYVEAVAKPYAAANGIDLQELQRTRRDGSTETLMQRLVDPRPCRACAGIGQLADPDRACSACEGTGKVESRSLPIPVRMSNGAPGNRSCTADFKIRVVSRWLKAHGATADHPATVGIGISLDEIQRANTRVKDEWERVVYPLIGIGIDTGLQLRRDDCMRIIRDAGLPVPPKSSCFFCPFHRPAAWADLARETPELFEKAVALEETLNARRERLGKDPVFLTRFNMPLGQAIATGDETLFELAANGEARRELPLLEDDADGECGGACWT